MLTKDIMTTQPLCCSPSATIREVARMMAEHDVGEIPVVDMGGKPLGVITDRDICCRAVAVGNDPNFVRVSEIMTVPAVTANDGDTVERCCDIMREYMIRRVPIVDSDGHCVGIVAQADVACRTDGTQVKALVKEVSAPTDHASRPM